MEVGRRLPKLPKVRVVSMAQEKFLSKVVNYIERTVSAAGVDSRMRRGHGLIRFDLTANGAVLFTVNIVGSEKDVTAGICMPGETSLNGAPQDAQGGDLAWRTFRFGYGDRFHVFGGALRREIEQALNPSVDQTPPQQPDLDKVKSALSEILEDDPEEAANRIAEALVDACSTSHIEEFLKHLGGDGHLQRPDMI